MSLRKRGRLPTVGEVGELALLRLIRRRFVRAAPGVRIGVGDDAAVLRAFSRAPVVTTDMLVEGVDFAFAWSHWADVGHKAAAVNLSDLAAMGAAPRALVVALALRPRDRVVDVMALLAALAAVGRRYGAPLVGGDLSATRGPMVVAVTAVGELVAAPLLRQRGRPGDVVLVSGSLGAAAAGLRLLWRQGRAPAELRRRQVRPEPRVSLGVALARSGLVRAAVDISDGLAADALHLARPGSGVALDAARLPIAATTARAAARLGTPAWRLALSGGEDFELALAVPRQHVQATIKVAARTGARLTPVGRIVASPGLHIAGAPGAALSGGFQHFSPRHRSGGTARRVPVFNRIR